MHPLEIPSPASFEAFPEEALERSIAERFAQVVERFADRQAVRTATQQLSYRELGRLADSIAGVLRVLPNVTEHPIAILARSDTPRIGALLGVLELGAAFVLLDPGHPLARTSQILEDSGARVLLAEGAQALSPTLVRDLLHVIELGSVAREAAPRLTQRRLEPFTPACILYTSGSSGKPKGILHSHLSLLANVRRNTNTLKICREDRVALLGARSMAQSLNTTLVTLLNGACLHAIDVQGEGLAALARRLADEEVSVYNSSASIFRGLARECGAGERFPSLRLVRLGSEAVVRADFERWRNLSAEHCRFVNALSSTETGTIRQLVLDRGTEPSASLLPVGFSVPDADLEVWNEAGEPEHRGNAGRLAVSSRSLALGYWRRPDLTAAHFKKDLRVAGERIFLAEDVGRLGAGGCLEHLGRLGSEVKIRGVRVELAEVEAALLEHAGVDRALVTIQQSAEGETALVAHVSAGKPLSPAKIRTFLRARLPDAMVPCGIVVLESLPETANGKVDRTLLPKWQRERTLDASELPRDLLESEVASLWEESLGLQGVGIREDFFELGGDSLLALELVTRLEKAFAQALQPDFLARHTTVEAIARALAERPARVAESIRCVQAGQAGQAPFFFHSGDATGAAFYCRRLARELGSSLPFYAILSHGVDGQAVPSTIEEMVEDRLPEILSIQPAGPYRVGGYCHGGVFAYELAQRLIGLGHEVEILVLVETVLNAPYARALRRLEALLSSLPEPVRPTPALRNVKALLRRVRWRLDRARAEVGVRARARVLLEESRALLARRFATPIGAVAPKPMTRVYVGQQSALETYLPKPYPSRVVLLNVASPRNGREPRRSFLPFVRRLEAFPVPGDHHSCITTHVGALADRMRPYLETEAASQAS